MNQIPPQPIPTVWGFDHTLDGNHVVVIAQTPLGTLVHFVETANVYAIAEALLIQVAAAEARSSGITVPGNVMLGPDGQPLKVVPPSPEVVEAMRRAKEAATEDEPDNDDSEAQGDG